MESSKANHPMRHSHDLQKTSMTGVLWQSKFAGAWRSQRVHRSQALGGLLMYKAGEGWETEGSRDKAKPGGWPFVFLWGGYVLLILERQKEGKRERNINVRNIDQLPPTHALTRH